MCPSLRLASLRLSSFLCTAALHMPTARSTRTRSHMHSMPAVLLARVLLGLPSSPPPLLAPARNALLGTLLCTCLLSQQRMRVHMAVHAVLCAAADVLRCVVCVCAAVVC